MPPKQGATHRRVSNPSSKAASTPASAEKAPKSSKPTRLITIKLPKARLTRFPHEPTPPKSVPKKKSPLSTSTLATPAEPPAQEKPKSEPKSDSSETPTSAPPKPATPSAQEPVKKEPSSPKTGSKRELGAGVEEPVKVKARPGPKKKPRL